MPKKGKGPSVPLSEQINRSGFPFQIAIEHTVRETESEHGWSLVATEFPWENGFIDLVLQRGRLTIVAECKRVANDKWIFLAPEADPREVERARLEWWNGRAPERHFYERTIMSDEVFCDDFHLRPASLESEYCVVPKGASAVTSLEAVSTELLAATHDIASLADLRREEDWEIYIPVVVTSADLVVCSFEPEESHLEAGKVESGNFQSVDLVRFRKSLVARRSNDYDDRPMSLRDWKEDRVRTVIVVRAYHFCAFLAEVERFRYDDFHASPPAYRIPDLVKRWREEST